MEIAEGTYSEENKKENIRQGFPFKNYWWSNAGEGAEGDMELHKQNDGNKFMEHLRL